MVCSMNPARRSMVAGAAMMALDKGGRSFKGQGEDRVGQSRGVVQVKIVFDSG